MPLPLEVFGNKRKCIVLTRLDHLLSEKNAMWVLTEYKAFHIHTEN